MAQSSHDLCFGLSGRQQRLIGAEGGRAPVHQSVFRGKVAPHRVLKRTAHARGQLQVSPDWVSHPQVVAAADPLNLDTFFRPHSARVRFFLNRMIWLALYAGDDHPLGEDALAEEEQEDRWQDHHHRRGHDQMRVEGIQRIE